MLQDLVDLTMEMSETSTSWLHAQPMYIQQAYKALPRSLDDDNGTLPQAFLRRGHPVQPASVQVLVILWLLERMEFPGLQRMTEDLQRGFDMMGTLHPARG